MSFLPEPFYREVEQSIPIACVDIVPLRENHGAVEVGLILRESPFGRVWCHLGGRILRGETMHAALQRHVRDTLDVELLLQPNRQPDFVFEWFPPELAPTDGTLFGNDPRKHAIGLSFALPLVNDATPRPQNEALDFGFFAPDALPLPLWPGTMTLLHKLQVVA